MHLSTCVDWNTGTRTGVRAESPWQKVAMPDSASYYTLDCHNVHENSYIHTISSGMSKGYPAARTCHLKLTSTRFSRIRSGNFHRSRCKSSRLKDARAGRRSTFILTKMGTEKKEIELNHSSEAATLFTFAAHFRIRRMFACFILFYKWHDLSRTWPVEVLLFCFLLYNTSQN